MTEKEKLELIFSTILEERNKFWLDQMKSEPNLRLSTSQMTETFILTKLAEIEYRLQRLESK